MSNVEIYDSSNSQLSSDEYTHDEDDDALMDVAVSKQTPVKQPKSQSSSNETTPAKSSSTETTPRKLSTELPDEFKTKPPANQAHTRLQIRQLQRHNQANLYFKRRSIKWLNQRLCLNIDYSTQLRRVLNKTRDEAIRNTMLLEERTRARELAERTPIRRSSRSRSRRSSRSLSRSRSRTPSGSLSPELICLDDTENEDSPEKLTVAAAPNDASIGMQLTGKKPPTPFTLDLQLETEATPAENGSVLDEFLTLKPVATAVPIIEEAAGCNELQEQIDQMQLAALASFHVVEPNEPTAIVEMPIEEATLKRRRSKSPGAEQNVDCTEKRSKTIHAEDLEDDDIEFMPNDMSATAKQQLSTPQPQAPMEPIAAPPPAAAMSPLQKAAATMSKLNAEPPNGPLLKLGSPFSLTPSSGMEIYAQQKTPTQQQQQQPENLAFGISYKLGNPAEPVDAMEIAYSHEVPDSANSISAISIAPAAASAPAGIPQQAAFEVTSFAVPQTLQQPVPQQQLLQQTAQQLQQKAQQMQQKAQQLQQTAQQQHQQEMSQQHQQQEQLEQQPRPNQRLESKQTQTDQTPPPQVRNRSTIDPNNSNNDAIFHQRVKEMYTEVNETMTDKVRSIKPDLKSYNDEKLRIEADVKTLDSLICQKEEEYHRLLHLRCIKEELRERIERKERILVMKEILPSILNKNCSTSELYEMHSLLTNEQNATLPSRVGPTAVEQVINRVENGLDNIKLLRSAMGLPQKTTSGVETMMPPSYYEQQQDRRNSLPSMRPPVPPVANDRSAVYGRQGAVRDVRGLIEDFRREHPEELPLVGKRNKPQPPQSRYQELINESKQLTNSTPDLTAASSYRQQQPPVETQRSHSNSLANHSDETQLRPLYYSSPLVSGTQRHQSRVNDANPQNNDAHSTYRQLVQELEPMARAGAHANRNNNNRSNRVGATTNGPEELEHRCQHCERQKATYMCAGCQNQWYCSRQCQLRAWDTHWESCSN